MAQDSNNESGGNNSNNEPSGRAGKVPGLLLGLLSNIVSALALIIGFVSYGAVYLAYDYVYAGIGVEPSELGLNYISLLGRSPGAVIWIALIAVVIFAFFVPGGRALILLLAFGTYATYSWTPYRPEVISVGKNVYGQVVQFSQDVIETRRSLVDGDALPPNILFKITALDVTAVPSKLVFLDDPANRLMQGVSVLGSGCVTYLGASDGLSVIYSPQTRTVIRLPVDKVILVRTQFKSTDECSNA